MPSFGYQAADGRGRAMHGTLVAANRTAALSRLRDKGLTPLRLAEVQPASVRPAGRVRAGDVLAFTQQLATLIHAKLQLDRALAIVVELVHDDRLGPVVAAIRRDVQEGASFSTALERHPRLFSRVYINMVRAGETGGVLPVVLRRLTETIEEERELRSFVLSALLYPAVVAAVSLIAIAVLLLLVVPTFERIFAQINQTLPTITRLTVALSHGLSAYGLWLALGAASAAFLLWRATRSPAGRQTVDRLNLRLPYLGDLYLKLATAQIARTLAMLVGAGVPVLQSLAVVKETVRNTVISSALGRAGQEIKEGGSIAKRLEAQHVLPALAIRMIAVGEETGELARMLEQVAKGYDRQVRLSLRNLLSLLEPFLILCLTAMTLLIALSILIPIVSMNTGMGL